MVLMSQYKTATILSVMKCQTTFLFNKLYHKKKTSFKIIFIFVHYYYLCVNNLTYL